MNVVVPARGPWQLHCFLLSPQVVVIAAGFDTRAYRLHQPNVKVRLKICVLLCVNLSSLQAGF